MRTATILLPLIAICICSAARAEGSFDGTWRLNPSKSQLAGDTMTFEDAGNGAWKFTDSAQSYTFKPDGSSFTTPMGAERTFQKTGDSGYTTTTKRKGVLLATAAWKLSSDGNTLVIEVKGTKPNGDTFDDTTTYVRTSTGSGLIGGWKSTKVKLSSPNSLTIQSDGDNGVTLTISAFKATCAANWDGKDHACSGPTVPDGFTVALSKTGPSGFKLVQKVKGKVLEVVHYSTAADGKSMVAKGVNGEGKEPFTEIWDKQS
ncbi:MAG TPA: hypothetical protein VK820_09660 [Steroidobacteraceae bacterium]|jgi:hypothetical protein|nr:hypothetical protein [Steroidobacteraceae bacterium]